MLSHHQSLYLAWVLKRLDASDSSERLAKALVDAQIELNPHQVEAALFAVRNPLSSGVILADEVGLGKTIEAGLVMAQRWAERRRRVLVVTPANLRKQWHQELQDKFNLPVRILDGKSHAQRLREGGTSPFDDPSSVIVCSYPFAKARADEIRRVSWDLVVMDEAHRLRNVYKPTNVTGKALKEALQHCSSKVLLTATPLQNSLMELYGLVSLIDDKVFGDSQSFRDQFAALGNEATLVKLRERLRGVCRRTLRRDVRAYVPYTQRRLLLQRFTPTVPEQALYQDVAEYLRRPHLHALGSGQRQLISLVLWKLLASSSFAIAGALGTMADRLAKEGPTEKNAADALTDYEALDETAEEWSDEPGRETPASAPLDGIDAEIRELREFQRQAASILDNSKGQALLRALDTAFAWLESMGAPSKALIFTESRRTQDYLWSLLERSPYAGRTVLFNGSNSHPQAQEIYQRWLRKHAGTDRISGSREANVRAALVEHFRDEAQIMVATEAGAEGINLQFCSLVINYDLPWNPQRIEQRIGRCHRYGQKHDVVVVNFLDEHNPADQRVHELLAEKFQLFEGVFGSSDEVLGAIGNGVDFERRIAAIYAECRTAAEIDAHFEALQRDMAGDINAAMVRTRELLFEHFDETVQEKLKLRQDQSSLLRRRYERDLLQLARAELGDDVAEHDEHGFTLRTAPPGVDPSQAPPGRYELPRRATEAPHTFRLGHPLAEALIERARSRHPEPARLRLHYESYGNTLSSLLPLRGQQGWLVLQLLRVEALGTPEEHLLLAGVLADGQPLHSEDADKLLRLPAEMETPRHGPPPVVVASLLDAMRSERLKAVNERNLGHFDTEVRKLDAWADDLRLGLETEVKDIDREIKEVRRSASVAPTLDEKLHWQKRQRELEERRNNLRRRIFDRQDEIEAQRNRLIDDLESRLQQDVSVQDLWWIEWELV